ncbi:MAG: carboxypeptidase regulatory-like domain-containing protein [Bryobacteraceae bacterium]|nr:carboxypeptidase regulatory-like domain-containing protein [Bryobacteraceae bacterium]
MNCCLESGWSKRPEWTLNAQIYSISGSATDSLAVIRGVSLVLNDRRASATQTRSDLEGKYSFQNLTSGSHRLSFSAPQFETADLNGLRLGGWTTFSGAAGSRGRFYDFSVNAENLLNRQRYFLPAQISSQVHPGSPINLFTTLRFRIRE